MKYFTPLLFLLFFNKATATIHVASIYVWSDTLYCSIGDTVKFTCGGPYSTSLWIYRTSDTVQTAFSYATLWTLQGNEVGYHMSRWSPNAVSWGKIIFTGVSLKEEESLPVLRLFPNPAKDLFTLSSDEPLKTILVSNSLGQVVLQRDSDQETELIDISQLQAGIYFIRCRKSILKLVKTD